MGMSRRRGFSNPFYLMLAAMGSVFCVTAFAYAVMTVQAMRGIDTRAVSAAGIWLNQTLDHYGFAILGIELSALAFCTVAAITTDRYWTPRDSQR
jgi:hypothetical protein